VADVRSITLTRNSSEEEIPNVTFLRWHHTHTTKTKKERTSFSFSHSCHLISTT